MRPDHPRTKTVQLNIRTTPAEAAEIRDQARRRGMSITQLIVAALRYVARLRYDNGFLAD